MSDRLHAIMRMPPEARPLVNVYGPPISQHAILGAAIQIGSEAHYTPLFPLGLFMTVPAVVERAVAAFKSAGVDGRIRLGLSMPVVWD